MARQLKWRLAVIFVLGLAVNVDRVKSSEELMKKMSKTFLKMMEECHSELAPPAGMLDSLVKFWGEGSDHEDRDLGCLILCMAGKHDLLHVSQLRVDHQSTYQFALDHGADEDTAKQLVAIIKDCENRNGSLEDLCMQMLETSRCFRDHLHQLKWVPSLEVVLGELQSEMA